MINSEPNEIEEFFSDLYKHPCRYQTKSMIDTLFQSIYGIGNCHDNKQYKHFTGKLVNCEKIKIDGESYRIKTFSMKEAGLDNNYKRDNIQQHYKKI